jgi:hypothetical protein
LKAGRKVTGYEVSVTSKKKSTIESIQKPNESLGIIKEIELTFGQLSETVLENILNHYSEEYILEKIAYTKKHAKKEFSGLYPIPYFISAIKHDYKFKEGYQPAQHLEEKVVNHKSEWDIKLHDMQTDLNHWNKLLECAINNNDQAQIKNIENIILNCGEKIKLHHLDHTVQEELV